MSLQEPLIAGDEETAGPTITAALCHHETVTRMFEDVQDVALCRLGVHHRDERTMPLLVRHYNFHKTMGPQDDAIDKAVRRHQFPMNVIKKLKWKKNLNPCLQNKFSDCNGAVFFRVKVSKKSEASTTDTNETNDTPKFPKRLLDLTLVKTEYTHSTFQPVDADVRGCWTGWTLTVNNKKFEGEMSNSFLITLDKQHKDTFQIDPRMKYFAWSYPVNDFAEAPDELRIFFRYGGFMYFHSHGQKSHFWKTPRELGQIMSVTLAEPGDPFLDSEPPIWLGVEDVERQWNNMKEVTFDELKSAGAKFFCWVAPGDRVKEDEDCPLGFPHGGYLYIGNFKPNDIQAIRDMDSQVRDDYTRQWWDDHLDALRRVVNRDSSTRQTIQEDTINNLRENLLHQKNDLLDTVHQARYIFQFPEENLIFSTIYFSVLWFRFPFMFLMTSMLTTAVFLGALMQVMFTVFGDIYDQGNWTDPATAREFIAFLLLPSLMVVSAIVVDQIWDLIFSAFSPPYFVDFRARLLAVCMGMKKETQEQFQAPSRRLCLWVDYGFLFGFELVPVLGALYNALILNLPMEWGIKFLPHFFYLGHLGKADTILGGYLSGMMYNCLVMVVIYTAVDIVYAKLEWDRPSEHSLRFVSEKFKAAIETYNINPMSMWFHHFAFKNIFKTGDQSLDGVDYHTNRSFWVGRYHEHEWKEASTLKKFWRAYKKVRLLIWYTPWILMVIYLWSQAIKPADEKVFTSLNWLPNYEMVPWLVTAFLLVTSTIRTSMVVESYAPKLVGCTYRASLAFFCLVQLSLFFGGSGYYHQHKSRHSMNGQMLNRTGNGTLNPIMTLNRTVNGTLRTIWPEPDPVEAQPYPICEMSWGDSKSSVSALDLAALSWIVYEKEKSAIETLLLQTFGRGPRLENFTNYNEIPRWIAVRFPPGWKHFGSNDERLGGGSEELDTLVVAVKGTSTFRDGYLDTDLFTTIKVLQFFEFLAPVLKILPVDMVQWMLKIVKRGTGGGKELDIWGRLNSNVMKLQRMEKANNRSTKFVLTGHSLGGGIAQIVAAQLGIKALVWSAPGTLYSQGFFSGKQIGSVSEERMQRNVVVVMPDNDAVPRVDSQESVVQRIQCFGKYHTAIHYFTGTAECHPIVKSACEVWRVCGDFPMHRDFSSGCSAHVDEHELGKLYPVLSHPILAPNEEF